MNLSRLIVCGGLALAPFWLTKAIFRQRGCEDRMLLQRRHASDRGSEPGVSPSMQGERQTGTGRRFYVGELGQHCGGDTKVSCA
jgi:hypothetical protein